MITLDQARVGQRCRIEVIDGPPELVQRMMEFGLLEGETVTVTNFAPLGDPLELIVGETRLSLRKREAAIIQVTPLD